MPIALDRDIRKTMERVVRDARVAAEKGALNALNELGVADAKRPAWLSPAQGELRSRLRAHARALGDRLSPDDTMRVTRLVREIAYAHWHRALFARFLLENGLLVDVEAGNAPVSTADIRAIADEENRDFAEVAAEFAQPMLPEIFRNDDPVLALALPPEARQTIAQLVDGLPAQTFKADDALGWTYQYWQSATKEEYDEAVKSGLKIGPDELPAVTQLFTEDYMVLFLLENTLGAWWAGKQLAANSALAHDAEDEEELRRKLSPEGYEWTYLRFVRDENGQWRPAAVAFPGWPETAREITMLDPCMGSGHFLVFALDILVALRKAEEGLDDENAVVAVLSDNLHGLEIDPRCTQIAAFALALSAWKRIGHVRPLPALNLACSGLAIGMGRAEFVKLAERIAEADGFAGGASDMLGRERNPMEEQALARRRGGLERLYDLFAQAPVLGSLIDPRQALGDFGTLFSEGFDGLSGIIGKVLDKAGGDPDVREAAVTAQGLEKAAELLARRFTLVATNVPYLSRAKMAPLLGQYIDEHFHAERAELANVFLSHATSRLGAVSAIVSPQNYLFMKSYIGVRKPFLLNRNFLLVAKLGPAAFQEMNWWAAVTSLTITSYSSSDSPNFAAIEFGQHRATAEKPAKLTKDPVHLLSFSTQLQSPSCNIAVGIDEESSRLNEFCVGTEGLSTGDVDRFTRSFWECPRIDGGWSPFQRAPKLENTVDGATDLVWWEGGSGTLSIADGARIQGHAAWGKRGVLVGAINQLVTVPYTGELFDKMCVAIVPKNSADLPAILNYCTSSTYRSEVRKLSQKAHVATATLTQVPFLKEDATTGAAYVLYSNRSTQWLFDGHPRGSADPNTLDTGGNLMRPDMAEHPLQVAIARLLGYRWPRQTGSSFMDCPVIDAPDEIDVSGRVDADGIVCLPALAGEAGAAERLRGVLQTAWGEEWREGVVRACLQAEEAKVEDLDAWLADEFFDGHCRLFHQTPFVWHIWDGLRGGFSALVNYHKLCAPDGGGRRLLEKLRDTYLGEWIARQRRLASDGDALAEDRLAAAEHLRTELTRIIEGEPPYDIFVRWKPLHEQPIGWEPDIDDGVRLNIRPFITARPRGARGAKACILRVRPGVKKCEGADRGGEPYREKADYPWFWAEDHDVATEDFAGGAEFKGRRYNDLHFSRRVKQAARTAKAPGSEAAE